MTTKRRDGHSTEFGLWLREQDELDSSLGYVASNIDYVWRNYRTGEWMLVEEKRKSTQVPQWQNEIFLTVDRACRGAPGYRGFHVITFENTNPDDGRMWLDGKEIAIPSQDIQQVEVTPTRW